MHLGVWIVAVEGVRVSAMWVAAICSFVGTVILWNLVVVSGMRRFGIHLPLSFAFLGYGRRAGELRAELKGRARDTYVLVCGFLLFACPLVLGFTAYAYVLDHYVFQRTENLGGLVGSLIIFSVFGFWQGLSDWKKAEAANSETAKISS